MAKGKPVVVVTRQLPREVETRMMEPSRRASTRPTIGCPHSRLSMRAMVQTCWFPLQLTGSMQI